VSRRVAGDPQLLSLPDWQVFPLLFGSGVDGDITISADTDGGCAGVFGYKQARNLTINSGIKLHAPAGSGNGGLVLAVSGVLDLQGYLRADGSNATHAVGASPAGNGGAGAGGNAGGPGHSTESPGYQGGQHAAVGAGGAGGSGAVQTTPGGSQVGGSAAQAKAASSIVPAFAATGLPYQQTQTENAATALGSTLARAWNRFALLAGAGAQGGSAVAGASGANRANGGGGGGGGGLIYIAARHINFGGSCALSAAGGNGGDGACNGAGSGWYGNAGQGGHGGRIVLICETYSGTPPTPNVLGGLIGRGYDGSSSTFVPSVANSRSASGEYTLIRMRG
jgi:hypothetical protein